MMQSNDNELINRILERIHEEVLCAAYTTGAMDITIFLSIPLFLRLKAHLDCLTLYRCSDFASVKLFGCNVEKYEDQGLAFYVTTAKKITY